MSHLDRLTNFGRVDNKDAHYTPLVDELRRAGLDRCPEYTEGRQKRYWFRCEPNPADKCVGCLPRGAPHPPKKNGGAPRTPEIVEYIHPRQRCTKRALVPIDGEAVPPPAPKRPVMCAKPVALGAMNRMWIRRCEGPFFLDNVTDTMESVDERVR